MDAIPIGTERDMGMPKQHDVRPDLLCSIQKAVQIVFYAVHMPMCIKNLGDSTGKAPCQCRFYPKIAVSTHIQKFVVRVEGDNLRKFTRTIPQMDKDFRILMLLHQLLNGEKIATSQ